MAQIVDNSVNCLNTTISPYACGGFGGGICTLTFHRSGGLNIISFNGSQDYTVVIAGITRSSCITFCHHTFSSTSSFTSYVSAVTMNGITGAAIYQTLNSPYPVPIGASTYKFPSAVGGINTTPTIGVPTITNNGGIRVPLVPEADGRVTFDLCAPVVNSGK